MDEHSSGDSAAIITRLSERAHGHAGVVDAEHPRQVYQRTAGWAAERFPLLAHLIARYDVNDYASAQDKPLLTVRPMSATTHDVSQFAQTADADNRIARQADNSASPSHSSEASSPAPAKYRISRRPSSLARMTDRSVLNTGSLANSSDIQSSETVRVSQTQTSGGAAQDNQTSDVELPMVSQRGTNGVTLEREAASAAEPAENDGSSDSDGSSKGLARRTQVETPPQSNESKLTGAAPISVAHSSSSSSAIIQKRQAPAELIYLRRYGIRRADSQVSPSTSTVLSPEAPAVNPAATDLSRQQISHSSSPLVLRKGSVDAPGLMEESPARSPVQPLAAPSNQTRDEVGTETDLSGNASSHRRPAATELIERQLNHAAEPLILRQMRSDATNVQEETVSDASRHLPLSVEAQDPELLKFRDRTATNLSGGGAAHPNIDPSNETVVTESFVSRHLPRPAQSLILTKTGAKESHAREEATRLAGVVQRQVDTMSKDPVALNSSVGAITRPNSDQAMSARVLSSSPTASASKGTGLPLVFLESSETQRAVQRSSEVEAGATPLVAPEMRADSGQAASPDIVWRKSATTQRDASFPVTQMTAGALVARQADGSSASSALPIAQPQPPVESNGSHSNGDHSNGGGIDVEHVIRLLHKRLAIERERRGIGR